ncbi:type II toxin-antitoxin system HicA family toxin [Cohnella herbarum]|uniref:Type II toxin-antitoxin system HicA family toxin n=1 Tax=Cohnella herbarum TaxID=2728023 RepID=A0A7Z2VQV6_9BACL|nr:type II toxin-antitoxin system HicA family toxin [Cohnella herbarum]
MAKWSELKRYLDRNGWSNYRTTDHYFYSKEGRRTKVSLSSGEIPPPVFRRILKDQLGITIEEFNKGK